MILYINACVRRDSRTERLAEALLKELCVDDQLESRDQPASDGQQHSKDQQTSDGQQLSDDQQLSDGQQLSVDQQTIEIRQVRLEDISLEISDEAFIEKRDQLIAEGAYDHEMFALARQFAEADMIVIAAPYWDLSFPASLKQYIEKVCVNGITFEYTPEGIPRGLCKAGRIYYVMTAGGDYAPDEYGYGYIRALAGGYYGINDVRLIKATGLDIEGADVEMILKTCIERDICGMER